jgi:hypothetical protein
MIEESARFKRLSISFAVLKRPTTLRLTYSSISFSTVSREAAAARLFLFFRDEVATGSSGAG